MNPDARRTTDVKSAVETLNPTRVRLTVEVPFDELKPSLDAAYRKIARQVNVPGFRRGKVPPRIIDQRFGRAVVLEEAVNDALTQFYGQAVEANEVQALGRPEVDVTEFGDGQELKFTAEVDVRPEIELPQYDGVEVTVADADVTDEEIDEELTTLRDRFSSLTAVDRPVHDGDHVTVDLEVVRDGQPMEDANVTGFSYEVGSGVLFEGLDEAVSGKSAGEKATFRSTLRSGEHQGEDVDVTVTIGAVQEKQLPELDDDFAQTASEFDTVDELRADLRSGLAERKKQRQLAEARDKVLRSLLDAVDMPLPEGVVQEEIQYRRDSFEHELGHLGLSMERFFQIGRQSREEYETDLYRRTREGIATQFLLDEVAKKEQVTVGQDELTQHLVRRAITSRMSPDEFAQQAMQAGQVPLLVNEVARSKALKLLMEAAKVRDESGRPVVIAALAAAGGPDALEDAGSEDEVESADEYADEPAVQAAPPGRPE
jgi:trigger factor